MFVSKCGRTTLAQYNFKSYDDPKNDRVFIVKAENYDHFCEIIESQDYAVRSIYLQNYPKFKFVMFEKSQTKSRTISIVGEGGAMYGVSDVTKNDVIIPQEIEFAISLLHQYNRRFNNSP